MRMTFYTANCRGNAKNSLYPNKRIIDNEADCMEVAAFDHVCGEFKGFRRSVDNFLSSREEQNIPKEAKGQRKLNVQCFSSRKKGSKASLEAQASKRHNYEIPV